MPYIFADFFRKHRKHTLEALAVVAVLGFLGVIVWGPSAPVAPVTGDAAVPEAGDVSIDAAPAPITVAAVTKKTVAKPLTYDQAIEQYGTYRIQFVGCHGAPGTLNVSANTKVMLDNRDAVAHSVDIGEHKTYKLPAYGFALAVIPTAGTYNVTCDGGGAGVLVVN